MASYKHIRRQIGSIKNTAKMTRAMQMISAVKSRRAQGATLQSRPYARAADALLAMLVRGTREDLHPLLTKQREVKHATMVVVSTNRGLCGSFFADVMREVHKKKKEVMAKYPQAKINFVTLGRKGRDSLVRQGDSVTEDFPKADLVSSLAEILPLAQLLVRKFVNAETDMVILVYTNFVSLLRQKPTVQELLPIAALSTDSPSPNFEYLFEPSPTHVLEVLLERMIETQLYQAVLESNAAEHAARMVAMKNATDNALDLVDALTSSFNQARQAAITKEVAEISSGRLALEG